MNPIDHDTFHALALDALFDELDGPGEAAVHAHAASCEPCGSSFERMRQTRQRGRAALGEDVPPDFEVRIMAAVDRALAGRAGGLRLVASGPATEAGASSFASGAPAARVGGGGGGGGKVIPFYSRPAFAAAASFLLLAGAAAAVSQLSFSRKAPAASAADESAPAAVAQAAPAPAASAAPPAEIATDGLVAAATASPAPPPAAA
ncbi:MAG: hypothetical protein JWP97_172, partial [Labilithrix sp.]|nr:hypothetical protein [Labilithrix sp.]